MEYSEAEENSPPMPIPGTRHFFEKCHQRWVNRRRMFHNGIKTVKVAVWRCIGDTIFNSMGECEAHCIPRPNKNNSNVCSLVLAGRTFLCGFGIIHPNNADDLFMVETRTNLDLLRIASRLVPRLMDFHQDQETNGKVCWIRIVQQHHFSLKT